MPRIVHDVIDADCAALSGSCAGYAFVKRHTEAYGPRIFIAHCENALEMLCGFVPEHDAKHVIVDEALDALGDAAQQLLAVQDGGQFAADVVKQGECFGLLGESSKKAPWNGVHIAKNCV